MALSKIIPMPPPPITRSWPSGWPGPSCPPPDCGCCPPGGSDWNSLQQCWSDINSFSTMLQAMLSQLQISTLGVTDGTEVAPGQVGELITASGTTIINSTPGTSTFTVINSMYLSPGDWGIYANYYAYLTGLVSMVQWYLMLTPATLPLDQTANAPPGAGVAWQGFAGSTQAQDGGTVGPVRMLTSTPIPCDLRANADATSGTVNVVWAMSARRIR